jgi:DNA-binding MarR family transcriptional regulator/uncharacterized membrane protein
MALGRAVALLTVLLLLAPLGANRASADEGWNDGTILIQAAPGEVVTQDGYPIRTAGPGSSVSLDLYIRNNASVGQTAVLWLHRPDDWHCVLTGSLVLPPGGSGKAMLRIDVPNHKGIDPDGTYTFRVEAVGNTTGDRAFILVILKIVSNVDHTFLIYPANAKSGDFQVYPGQRTFMDLLVRNIGNIADAYTLTIGEHRTDWDIQFREGSELLTIDLSPPEFENIYMTRLEVAVPGNVVPGEVLELELRCTSELASLHSTGRTFSSVSIRLLVVHGASIGLVPGTSLIELSALEETSVTVTVVHSGFIGCSYAPTASVILDGVQQSDWALETRYEGDGLLENGETEEFRVFIKAPSSALGEHILRVGASSQQAIVKPVDIRLVVYPIANIAFENVRGGPFLHLEDVEVTFDVVNSGTVSQDLVVSVHDVPEGLTAKTVPDGPFRLGPGSIRTLKVIYLPSEGAVRSAFDIQIICHYVDTRMGVLLEAARTSYRVVFIDALDITVIDLEIPDGQVTEGEEVRFNITIRNSGQVDIPMVEIMVHEVTFSLSRLEIGRNSTSLTAGEVRTITFTWRARPSAQSIRVEAALASGAQDSDPSDNEISRPIYVLPSKRGADPTNDGTPGGYVPAGAALAAVLGFGTLAGLLIFLVNTDLFRYPFFFTLYPLYSKLRPETLLSNKLRKRIYVYVQNNPGEHFRSILVKLNLTNGTLAHHLCTLEKEDLIRSEKDGLYRRFYPAGYHMIDNTARLSAIQRSILDCIEKRPGLSQKDISGELSLSNSTVNYNVKVLEEKKVIESKRVGKSTSLFPVKDTNS